ncbi:MAG: hypothetical protein FRX49_07404 [Trebouxia sp. A1-2]|nr:MAG: hypothetical protein FRX49_07404 [Trebouxia sp. A1-2]
MKPHLFIRVLFGDQIIEADALPASKRHRAVIGNVNAIKAQQDVSFLEGLADWGCWLHPPDQNALLRSFMSAAAASPQQRDKARRTGISEQTLQLESIKEQPEQSLQVEQQTQADRPMSHSVPTART